MCHVYILKSTVSLQYYVGYTCDDLLARISKHDRSHKGFTGRNQPWLLVYSEQLQTKQLALKREQEIKAWKGRIKIDSFSSLEYLSRFIGRVAGQSIQTESSHN